MHVEGAMKLKLTQEKHPFSLEIWATPENLYILAQKHGFSCFSAKMSAFVGLIKISWHVPRAQLYFIHPVKVGNIGLNTLL